MQTGMRARTHHTHTHTDFYTIARYGGIHLASDYRGRQMELCKCRAAWSTQPSVEFQISQGYIVSLGVCLFEKKKKRKKIVK